MRLLNELADDPILMKVRSASERDDEQVPSHPCNHNISAVLSMKGWAEELQDADKYLLIAASTRIDVNIWQLKYLQLHTRLRQ